MIPDANRSDCSPEYLRELVRRSRMSQVACAAAIGIAPRTMRAYLSAAGPRAPYSVQFALEALASFNDD